MPYAPGRPGCQQVGFLLVPRFSMMAFVSAIEPLRAANRLAERPLYGWRLISPDGAPVHASNGIPIGPDAGVGDVDFCPIVVVCAGIEAWAFDDRRALAWLRRLAQRGAMIGAVSTGSWVLARAGLLEGRRCTIHWEDLQSFAESYPDLEISEGLFEFDGDRFTCSGGTAGLDVMLHLVALQHGQDLAASVSDQFIHAALRAAHEAQRMTLRQRLGISHAKLLAAVATMESRLEEPVSPDALAHGAGLSRRQLERLFRAHLGRTPSQYYLELRLGRARRLLAETSLSVMAVAVACGFVSAAHFSRCFRARFGHSPRAARASPLRAAPPSRSARR